MVKTFIAAVLIYTLVAPAHAEEASAPAAHLQVTPTENGVLLSPETFTLYLRQGIALEECGLRVGIRDKLLAQAAERAERGWFERNAFWIGVTVGFVGAIAMTAGTIKAITAAK